MGLNPGFSVDDFEAELLEFRKRYVNDCLQTTDLMETKKLRENVQTFLDTQIT